MRHRLLCLLLAGCALFHVAGAKKKPEATVRFYPQVPEANSSTFATQVPLANGQGGIWISKIPTISENDILAFYPFQNKDGSLGAYFKLDDHGTLMLDTISIQQRGQYLVVVVNARHVLDLLIDKRISDGMAAIPKGLTPLDLELLHKKFRIIGEIDPKKG